MDRRIRVEEAVQARDPVTREATLSWPPDGGLLVGQVWAERLEQSGREFYRAQQRVAEISAGWRVRWSVPLSRVTAGERFRVLADGREYDLVEVEEEGRRAGLLLFGKARSE